MSEEALQIAEKRREAKSKGEKERYKHLNAEFQRIARRDEKAFLSDQCKEIEENNRMGKTRDLFKKIRDTNGTFHAKMGSIKDRNGMDLTEAEDIKKRWQEYTEELYRKKKKKKIYRYQVLQLCCCIAWGNIWSRLMNDRSFPSGSDCKESACNAGGPCSIPVSGKIP